MKPAAWSSLQKSFRGLAKWAARRRRDEARVDSAEDDVRPGPEDVGDRAGVQLTCAAPAARRAAHGRAASGPSAATTSARFRLARSGSSSGTPSRGELRLTRVQPNLEEPAQSSPVMRASPRGSPRLELHQPHCRLREGP